MKLTKSMSRWLPAIIVMAVIFMLSSLTGKTIKDVGLGNEGYHVGGHFLLFFILCVSFYKGTKNVWLSVLFTFLYAILDETHQLFILERAASFKDIVTDSLSAFLAGIILWNFYHNLPKTLKNWLSS